MQELLVLLLFHLPSDNVAARLAHTRAILRQEPCHTDLKAGCRTAADHTTDTYLGTYYFNLSVDSEIPEMQLPRSANKRVGDGGSQVASHDDDEKAVFLSVIPGGTVPVIILVTANAHSVHMNDMNAKYAHISSESKRFSSFFCFTYIHTT